MVALNRVGFGRRLFYFARRIACSAAKSSTDNLTAPPIPSRRLRSVPFLMERLWFKIRKQPRPVLLHEVPEFVGHQRVVNIRPFDKAADARQLLWRKIIVSTHGADDSRTRLGFSQLLSWGGVLRSVPLLRPIQLL